MRDLFLTGQVTTQRKFVRFAGGEKNHLLLKEDFFIFFTHLNNSRLPNNHN